MSRLLKIIGLLFKRALENRLYLQKRPMIVLSLLIVATHTTCVTTGHISQSTYVFIYMHRFRSFFVCITATHSWTLIFGHQSFGHDTQVNVYMYVFTNVYICCSCACKYIHIHIHIYIACRYIHSKYIHI